LPIGVFGWRLERRHGPLVVLLIFILAGMGGILARGGDRERAPGTRRQTAPRWA